MTRRSRYGSGRHRQPWIELLCQCCGMRTLARRTCPGCAWHVRAHWTDAGELCGCTETDTVVPA